MPSGRLTARVFNLWFDVTYFAVATCTLIIVRVIDLKRKTSGGAIYTQYHIWLPNGGLSALR